ncbi:GNAT family N-acetyltransferase [Agromyces sp. H3Y2-19a]|uniref:GNAT family N-acetyltransferase n=1 Tax=Agromyces chromiiresistens TaxID=3030835 RepID=UPI0023B97556|nr:GNAT family N-acetyltransferase [Agromyces chromiiresistens]MDF0512359.1 GNAT family N-acetyltransferase [Agromyces chromiiresistens]
MPEIAHVDPLSPAAVAILRRYYDDIITRYYGRAATAAEIDEQLAGDPDDDLRGDLGSFFIATGDEGCLGCAGVRWVDADTAELTRVFVAPAARGLGLAATLVGAVETEARRTGRRTVRLDTRSDLVEARALYAKLGYAEVEPFNDSPYADHWFAKDLRVAR